VVYPDWGWQGVDLASLHAIVAPIKCGLVFHQVAQPGPLLRLVSGQKRGCVYKKTQKHRERFIIGNTSDMQVMGRSTHFE